MDPNVLVSAALSENGPPWSIIRHWHIGTFEMVTSHELLFELQTVLMRRKFRRYLTEDEALEFVLWLREGATLAEEGEILPATTDPDDDYLIALAANSGSQYLVSGDGDLLDLEGTMVNVVSPRKFHEILESPEGETYE